MMVRDDGKPPVMKGDEINPTSCKHYCSRLAKVFLNTLERG